MKLVVCVKQVATIDEELELRDDGLDADFELELNEWDAFSLETALQLREGAAEGGEVVVVTVGDEDAEEALVECLARGADRAVRIAAPELAGGEVLGIAAALAAAVEREEPDLVLCGVQSSDAASAATGVALAGRLGLPRVAVVKRVERDPASGSLTVWRELEAGASEVLGVRTPALLTIQTGSCQPRYANLRAIKQAREKPLAVCGLDELGLAPSAVPRGSRLRGLRAPETGTAARMLEGDAAELAAAIREIIEERVAR
ncbi:MAG: electron transfer flavoprotein subunit beta/FixA family protein [Solirubrobacterales bacterium]